MRLFLALGQLCLRNLGWRLGRLRRPFVVVLSAVWGAASVARGLWFGRFGKHLLAEVDVESACVLLVRVEGLAGAPIAVLGPVLVVLTGEVGGARVAGLLEV